MRTRRGEGGSSLVGMLLTLVALGLMAAVAVKAVDGDKDDRKGTGALIQQLAEQAKAQDALSSGAQPSAAGPSGASGAAGPSGPGGMFGAAAGNVCRTNLDLIEKALGTSNATGQPPPLTIEELVERGTLSEVPVAKGYVYTLEAVDGRATGRVLVNGKPGTEGCSGG